MKTIFRFLGLAVLIAGFTAVGGTSIFAQDPAATPAPAPGPCEGVEASNALYEKVTKNYNAKDWQTRQLAIDAGEEYVKTYGACETSKPQVDYIKGALAGWKEGIRLQQLAEKRAALLARFNPAIKAANWDETYASGREFIALEPDSPTTFNIILALGSIGLDETLKTPRVTKYNDDTLKYARMAIDKLNAGKTSSNFGVAPFAYVVKDGAGKVDNAASKENALGWLNYTIGTITYFGQNNKKDGLTYLYKATQASSDTKKLAPVYGILGDYYLGEVARLGEEIRTKTIAANNKPTPETDQLIAQLKAYAERGIDAYARAQSLVTDPKQKAYKDGLGVEVEKLYKARFQKTDGLSSFVAAQLAKPLPDPSTVPSPIVEVEPDAVPATTGTTPTTTPGTTKPGTAPATNGTKPVVAPATNGTKPIANPATPVKKPVSTNGTTSGTTTAAAKPVVKKPVVKKKGTR